MNISFRTIIIPVVLLVATGTTIFIHASSKSLATSEISDDPIGSQDECGGQIFAITTDWEEEAGEPNPEFVSAGSGTVITKSTTETPLPSVTKRIVRFSADGWHPEYGDFSWTLDESRTQAEIQAAGLPTITAASPDEDFPATAHIRFYIKVTFESLPGEIFRSRTPVEFTSEDIATYPFEDETLQLAAPVEFEDRETGVLKFTAIDGHINLTTTQQ